VQIVIRHGLNAGRTIVLSTDRVTVGRASENDIPLLGDWLISRRHCEIRPCGTTWALIDVGSKNGTLLNDRPVTEPRLLRSGDLIRLGQCELAVE